MAAYVIKNKVKDLDQLKNFSGLGYSFDETQSNLQSLVFIRQEGGSKKPDNKSRKPKNPKITHVIIDPTPKMLNRRLI